LVSSLTAEIGSRGGSCQAVGGSLPEQVDDLQGVVVVAPADGAGFRDAELRWFSEAPAAVRLLGAAPADTRFVTVTRDALPATGVASRPVDAMALGIALVADREYPTVTARAIDIVDGTSVADLVDDVVGDGPDVIAHRDGGRSTPGLEHETVPLPDADTTTFREGGTYVVTGGLGGIGHAIAMHLAAEHRADLVLISSAELPPSDEHDHWLATHAFDEPTTRRLRHLKEIEALGTNVDVVADMASPASVSAALDEAVRRVGPITGAVHAAGAVRDVLIEFASPGDHSAVLDVKAQGALVLADELAARDAELLLLVSSTSTAVAPAGQASYVGANAVLDALAGRRDRLRIATINYGLWAGVGIASDMARRTRLGIGDTEPVDHPVFDERHVLQDGSTAFTGRIDDEWSWVVDEHRTADGVAVYPGAGHVHLMLSAAELMDRPTALTDVALLTPLVVPEDTPVSVQVVVSPQGRVEVYSDDGVGDQWELRSQATLTEADRPMAAPAAGSMEITGEITEDLLGAQREHMRFGSRWDSTVKAVVGDRAVVGELSLPTGADEARRWSPHPALLDLVTGAGVALASADAQGPGLFVPTGYRSIRCNGMLPADVRVRAVPSATEVPDRTTIDLVALDEAGEAVLAIDGLELLHSPGHTLLETTPADHAARASASLADLADELGVRPAGGAPAGGPSPDERLVASDHDRMVGSTIDLADLVARVDEDEDGSTSDGTSAASLEAAMTNIWAELLGQDDVRSDDDFFDLGGHSLIAIRLMARIHNEIGVRLQLAAIFEAPTIELLCAHVRAEHPEVDAQFASTEAAPAPAATAATPAPARPPRRLLVPISTAGDGTPLYVVHGAGGNVLFLGSFGRALADRPVFGFQAQGVNAGEVADDTVDRMARRYLSELRSHGPGPYLLGGYSGGGSVALEMARLLQEDGEQVRGVVLFDSPVGRISLGRWVHLRHLLRNLFTRGPGPVMPIVTSRLHDSGLGRRLAFMGHESVQQQSHEANYADMRAHGFNDLYDHFTEVAEAFEVGQYDVDAVLVKARLRWPLMSDDYGWSEHIGGRLDMVIADGDHESMFHAENAPTLAADLAPLLDRLDSST
jgi:thioesterase domain-containing protein/NAD(P)-dependent dehydrogenase (short-subunit alcohol dehydrogenase family)/acyl carrier protein